MPTCTPLGTAAVRIPMYMYIGIRTLSWVLVVSGPPYRVRTGAKRLVTLARTEHPSKRVPGNSSFTWVL
jgi:hypothetical protein